jgi:cation transport regulator ChaB
VWAALVHQRALVEEANKRLSQQSTETAELHVAYAAVKEEVAQAREAEAMRVKTWQGLGRRLPKPARTLYHCWCM